MIIAASNLLVPMEGHEGDLENTQKLSFKPQDLSQSPPIFSLPDELWISVLSQSCSFSAPTFLNVIDNLIRNPNISSSHLFRAEIFYDSENDTTIIDVPNLDPREIGRDAGGNFSLFTKHMKSNYRPRGTQVPEGFDWQRTLVRRLVPRNPQLDKDLVQTVHFFKSVDSRSGGEGNGCEKTLVLQIPHVDTVEDIPWYHPAVEAIAIIHSWIGQRSKNALTDGLCGSEDDSEFCSSSRTRQGELSIHYSIFSEADASPLSNRLARTAHHLLNIIYKHGQGQLAGYTKRVHHDLIIPQARFQDTYTRLKLKYAKSLINDWREQTDPGKHVFEDLGIAAFLIELWRDMYSTNGETKGNFPGFVDVGCGNGVLVYILLSEGYDGWGFDARRRKSWEMLPYLAQSKLKEGLLVPQVLRTASGFTPSPPPLDAIRAETQPFNRPSFHSGHFEEGTFIISNHADELTPWTPLLASLSQSPFIAIPCCSHNLSGARFRAPTIPYDPFKQPDQTVLSNAENTHIGHSQPVNSPRQESTGAGAAEVQGKGHNTGSLAKPQNKSKPPSAYATLTVWVAKLSQDVGYVPEKEMLRIPSTRNAAVLGRRSAPRAVEDGEATGKDAVIAAREDKVKQIVMRELGGLQSLEEAGREWVKRAMKLGKKDGVDCGH